MGCCSTFSAAGMSAAAADPSRHVNFTTGMVLGVDDYHQEFVYHSARTKWVVRDLFGYGTLSGLAVGLEDDANGPRVCVTAGSAAAPSGQLICVGRDQCASINAWLARKEVVEKLGEITGGSVSNATLSLFLTLCYVDCPVAEVPIPGEPCRSDENLMAPSRIQDDYCLEFRFDAPPPMREEQALDALSAFWPTMLATASNTDSAFDTALRRAEAQLRLAMGIGDPAAPPPAADLDAVDIHPDAKPRLVSAIKKLWITRLRPFVVAQRCNADGATADDCLLLARLTVPVVKAGDHWEAAGLAATMNVDERDRPLMLTAAAGQTRFGGEMAAAVGDQKLAFVTIAGNIPPDASLVMIRTDSAIDIKVPSATQTNSGKMITIRSASDVDVKLTTPPNTKIDNKNDIPLPKRTSVTLISDGANKNWFIASKA